jgi:hypothetical protein
MKELGIVELLERRRNDPDPIARGAYQFLDRMSKKTKRDMMGALQFFALGNIHGYPTCCIIEFIEWTDHWNKTGVKLDRVHSEKDGRIMCLACQKKEGVVDLEHA